MIALYVAQIESETGRILFADLYDKYYKLMFVVAFDNSCSKQAAEDIVHNAFLRLIKIINENKLDFDRNIEGYLATITSNEAKRYWNKLKNETILEDETLINYMPKSNYTVDTFEIEQLINEVKMLDITYRGPLTLYATGYQIREIAEILQLTETNVKQRLYRGRRMLLSKLEVNDE